MSEVLHVQLTDAAIAFKGAVQILSIALVHQTQTLQYLRRQEQTTERLIPRVDAAVDAVTGSMDGAFLSDQGISLTSASLTLSLPYASLPALIDSFSARTLLHS